jgi:hypothetical protein
VLNEPGSLASGLLVVIVLILLLLFIVRGGKFGLPSGRGGNGGLKGFGRGRPRPANRTPLEVFFALFAIANLVTSNSVSKLGPLIIVTALILLVIASAVFDLGLLAVAFGAVAAFADVALDVGVSVAVAVLVITAFLAWIYFAVGGTASRRSG